MRFLLLLLVGVVSWCACQPVGTPALEAPHILSLSPTEQDSFVAQVVTVQLDQDPRFQVDYGKRSAVQLEQPVLWVGALQVPLDTYLGHGLFQGTVPPGLDAGGYDIRVTLGDGREASLVNAYQIKPTVGFWLEHIADQVQDQPFTVTVHAAGPSAELFVGPVTMHRYMGAMLEASWPTGPFSEGMRQEQLSISTPGTNYLIVVEDDAGHSASSNAFRVDPPPDLAP